MKQRISSTIAILFFIFTFLHVSAEVKKEIADVIEGKDKQISLLRNMSYRFGAIAVKADLNATWRAMRNFFSSSNDSIIQINVTPPQAKENPFKIDQKGEWTIIAFYYPGILPHLVIHLSECLQTKAISISEEGITGYEHFAMLNNGKTEMLFTFYNKVIDLYGIDNEYFFYISKQGNDVKLPSSYDKDYRENPYYEYFGIFLHCIADIDVEELAVDILNADDLPYYDYTLSKDYKILFPEQFKIGWNEIVQPKPL